LYSSRSWECRCPQWRWANIRTRLRRAEAAGSACACMREAMAYAQSAPPPTACPER